jgi:hypothetical protein
MKNWEEYKAEVGLDEIPYPEKEFEYFAYQGGKVLGIFKTMRDAQSVSMIVEKVWVNEEEYNQALAKRNELESKALTAWNADLRKEHSEVSDRVFNLCYTEAYDRGHSAGLDEVANCMYWSVDFAKSIINATKE